jgi:hypothetical protein
MCVPLPHEQDTNSADTAYEIVCLRILDLCNAPAFTAKGAAPNRFSRNIVLAYSNSNAGYFGMADQTKDSWKPQPGIAAGLGTGILATQHPEPPFIQIRYELNVYYPDFVAQMYATPNVIEYQWVPHYVASYPQLLNVNCGVNLPCTPASGCATPGCLCINNVCTRRP